MDTFRGYVVDKAEDGAVSGQLKFLTCDQLDAGDVTIRVHYSSVNYKDALAATGLGKIIRRFPCVGGIDLAGEVITSADARYKPGDKVIALGFDIGVSHHGGYAEIARIPADWIVPLPPGLDLLESMALGTAGFTAGLAFDRMERAGLMPASGPVIVTGATGGVGSLAIDMLANKGYEVVALTRKESESDYLKSIGASAVKLSTTVDLANIRPLETAQWAGAIDNLGGPVLSWLIASMKQSGIVASIGNAASPKLDSTVFPFILRGVSLLGIDSGNLSFRVREGVWKRLAGDLKPRHLLSSTRVIDLATLPSCFQEFTVGQVKGRTVVRIIG
ncbi:oxidoreductase [Noviherbaspirillum malthae]|jgi:alcohol dehydrogenase|uniref:oxidoreductase n=1 Tax=Noviherbaspirillum malthae TaxID=1260987 RepID=UPI00188EFDE6|nr:oxidoreductase [Noviherbaspirillum malthae]